MKIEGVGSLIAKLKARAEKSRKEDSGAVITGFTAAYALWVHENMEMRLAGQPRPSGRGNYWDPQGQAGPKFLENPARELSNSSELSRILTEVVKRGGGLTHGLLACGMRIQREAQARVPIDTGNLRASAFTRKEESKKV